MHEFTCLAAVGDTIDRVKVELIWNRQSSQKRLSAYVMLLGLRGKRRRCTFCATLGDNS